jgi:hypothetical protein
MRISAQTLAIIGTLSELILQDGGNHSENLAKELIALPDFEQARATAGYYVTPDGDIKSDHWWLVMDDGSIFDASCETGPCRCSKKDRRYRHYHSYAGDKGLPLDALQFADHIKAKNRTTQRKTFSEMVNDQDTLQLPELEVGDELMVGKFKNRRATIKGFDKDKHKQPIAKTNKGDQQIFKGRIAKLMDESDDEASRLTRARDMGFDTEQVLYHSSLQDVEQFTPHGNFAGHLGVSGVSLTDSPEAASRYLDRYGGFDSKQQPFSKNIIPVYIRKGAVLKADESPYKGRGGPMGFPLPDGYVNPMIADKLNTLVVPDAISKKGSVKHSTAKNAIRSNEYIIADPKDIRSVFAAFDPANTDSTNLMDASGNAISNINWVVPKWARNRNYKLVPVSVDVLDRLWRKDRSFYIAPGANGSNEIKGRYERFEQFINQDPTRGIEASEIGLTGNPNAPVAFDNGRHRFAWARDHGIRQVMVLVPNEQSDDISKMLGMNEASGALPSSDASQQAASMPMDMTMGGQTGVPQDDPDEQDYKPEDMQTLGLVDEDSDDDDDYEEYEPQEYILPAGTELYHGTSAEDWNEVDEDIQPPFWVTEVEDDARYFVDWNGQEGQARMLHYRNTEPLKLLLFHNRNDMTDFSEHTGIEFDSTFEAAEDICARGFNGWIVPGNYQYGGSDIMLCSSANIEYIGTENTTVAEVDHPEFMAGGDETHGWNGHDPTYDERSTQTNTGFPSP